MKKNFTRLFALVMMSAFLPSMALGELTYNVPFSAEDWDWSGEQTTIVASVGSNSWADKHGICLGDNTLGGFDYDDKYVVIALSANGTPERLTANTLTRDTWGLNTGATGVLFAIATSTDNVEFTEIWSSADKKNNINIELPANARYVKILYSGNFAGCVQNLTVSGVLVETGCENVSAPANHAQRVMINGQIYILKDNQLYDCLGRMVK